MTLRIPAEIHELLCAAASESEESKTGWITAAIRQRLRRKYLESINLRGNNE